MDLELNGKTAIVTGGSSGIGEAISWGFAREGARVIVVGRNKERGQRLTDQMTEKGYQATFVAADLSIVANCELVAEQALKHYGQVDILVNNAGVNDGAGLADGPEQFWQSLEKNLLHYYGMAHYALPHLKKTGGNIVNVGSKVGATGQGGTSGYAASKGGIMALTREWAVELAPEGIRVNEVIPAETWTPLYERWLNTFPDPEAEIEKIASNIPLERRFTTSEEIANTVLFVASPRASHTTGQHLYVDGGYTHLDRAATS